VGGVRLRDLTWRPLGRSAPTLAGVDLDVADGERVLLVGASGSGKSTLLHGLAGALGTTFAGELSGSAEVEGRFGLLLQNPGDGLVAERIGRDVAFGPENLGLDRDRIWSRVDEALEAVRMPYGRDHLTAALSGGELQRLALAGVLAMRPDVLLLDEPTSMLDDDNAAAVRDAVLDAARGRTLLVVEHRIEHWLPHVDRVVVMEAGRLVADGSVAQFLASAAPVGVWAPGMPVPTPLDVPATLIRPDGDVVDVRGHDVGLELVTRSMRGAQRTRALDGLTARLAPGSITGLRGPSGAGKSTALAVFGGLLRPTSGVLEPALHRHGSRELAGLVGWVPQNPEHGFLTQSVSEEVAHTGRALGRTVDAGAVLDLFGLGRYGPVSPYRLSGGEQRRLALAAALAHRPGLVLLDEPTVGQDPDTWAAVVGWMRAAAHAGAAVGIATHDSSVPLDVEVRLRAGAVV